MNALQQRLLSRAGFRPRPARRGFALIVTLSLMTLLMLLVLTLVVLVRVNMQTATTNLLNAEARQNALVGAQIGLGQLQKFAGPDQRITTTADIGRINDTVYDQALTQPPGSFINIMFNVFNSQVKPYGLAGGYGGTRAWTAVWANQYAPLSIYTAGNTTANPSPTPFLLTFLVSGNENTPLWPGPSVTSKTTPSNAPAGSTGTGSVNFSSYGANYIPFLSSTPLVSNSTGAVSQNSWTALSNDLFITSSGAPSNDLSTTPNTNSGLKQPAVMLAGANTVGSGLYSLSTASGYVFSSGVSESANNIIVPMVNITVPSEQSTTTNLATGRMAYWVRDEGVKAKYTPTDPYAGQLLKTGSLTGVTAQVARYRFFAPQRTGIERMDGFANYFNLVSPTSAISSSTANVTMLSHITQPSQILLVDGNLSKTNAPTTLNPQAPYKYLQQHFNDFTTYSYGVEADALRGGLRYDLTTAFEPGTSTNGAAGVLFDQFNGLAGKSFLPYAAMGAVTPTSSNPPTTEPNAAMNSAGTGETATINGGAVLFNGPAMAPKWNLLSSYYNIAVNNLTGAANPIVTMVPGNSTTAGISPLIVQGRLEFAMYSDSQQQSGVAVYASFILANPYNFPIEASAGNNTSGNTGGLDLGYRISTDTKEDWGLTVEVRSSDQHTFVNIFSTSEDLNVFKNAWSPANGNFTDHGNLSTNYGFSGYLPLLKNPVSFSTFASNSQIDSVLDQMAFHISQADSLLQPGEAKIYSIGGGPTAPLTVGPNGTYLGGAAPQAQVAAGGSPFILRPGSQCFGYIPNNGGGNSTLYSVPMTPGFNPLNFVLRMAGNRETGSGSGPTATGSPLTQAGGNPGTPSFWSPVPAALVSGNVFPDPFKWGWLSSVHPSVAMTIEARMGGAAPGNSTLQDIINMDLSGAGLSNPINASSTTYTPFGSGNNTTYYHNYPSNGNATHGDYGNLPYYIGSYYFTMVPPNSTSGFQFFENNGSGTTPAFTMTPNLTVAFRNFADYNLRAVNMALPPFMPLTTPSNSPSGSGVGPVNNGFLTVPLYTRIFDEGPYDNGGGAPAGTIAAPFNIFTQNTLGFSGAPNDMAWGYSDSNNGPQYNIFYALPQRTANTPALLAIPNAGGATTADVPILSIGQLTNADVTADDVYTSVGYQPGNAIGNSLYTPYVSRAHVIELHNNLSSVIPPAVNSTVFFGNATLSQTYKGWATGNTSTAANNANAYDISYLMNTVLWDRYFFSGLYAPSSGSTTAAPVTANNRLKFAAGFSLTNGQANTPNLGIGLVTKQVVDPVTGQNIFRAYAPARYMMIDGAFNVNSTSYDAWRAVLSSMRGIPINNGATSTSTSGTTNIPRFIESNSMTTGAYTSAVLPITSTSATAGADPQSFAGFRQLTDADIDNLAFKIVQQVRLRGPFLSLAQFVNRRIGSSNTDFFSYSGALQTAIDYQFGTSVGLTHNSLAGEVTVGSGSSANMVSWGPANITLPIATGGQPKAYPDGIPTPANGVAFSSTSANLNSKVEGIPAWLTQADILQAIGSIIAVRSDTFVIRAYGDVLNPLTPQTTTGKPTAMSDAITNDPTLIQSRAWCEMVVQRYPDYLDTTSTASYDDDPAATNGVNTFNPDGPLNGGKTLSLVNATFGRRFRIVSIRWLNPTDI